MSTRNLRELLEIAEEAWPGRPINAVARKELEAIEKAAMAWSSRGSMVPGDVMNNFWSLLESIAKEASCRSE